MIRKIRVRPASSWGTNMFICQFSDNGQLYSLLENGAKGKLFVGALPEKTAPKIINFIVHPKRPNEYTFEFECDDKKIDSVEWQAYQKFWLKHPLVMPPKGQTNPNFKITEFIMEDLTDMRTNEADMIELKSKVYNKFKALDAVGEELRNQRNVAYYYGIPQADSMDATELMIALVGNQGVLMQEENIEKFLKYKPEDAKVQLAINTRRAIEKGIVEQRTNAGRVAFFVNNHPIGDTEDAVINYMDTNETFYHQYVVQKLGDDAEVAKKEAKKHTAEEIKTDDIEGMKKEMKAKQEILVGFGVKGASVGRWANMQNVDKIKEALKEADELIEKHRDKSKEISTSI